MRKIFSLLISLIMIFNFVILDVTQAVERTEQLNSSVSSVQEEVIETDTENKNVTEESIDEKTSDDITINKEESSSQSLQDNQEIEASVGGNIEKELDSNKLNVIDLVVPYMKSLVTPYSMFYGSNIITNLSVSPVDIGHTGDIKVSVDFAGQTEDPSRDDYIQVGQRITIPISAESGAYVKLKSQIPEIKGLKITADSNEIVIEFTEEIKNQYGVKGNVHITYSGINQDEGTTKVVSIGGKEVSITNRIGGDVGVFAGKAGMMYGESNPGYVTWFLRGNINGENWPGGPLIINDKLGEGQELDGNGIEIALYWGGQQHKTYEMTFDSIEDFLNNADYGRSKGSKIEYNKVNGTIDINIPEEVLSGKEFSFKYDAKITDVDLEKYTNDADFKFYEKGEPDTINETAEVTNIDQGGYITGKTRAWLNINKVLGEEEKPLAGVKFKVTREDGGTLYEGREEKEAVFTTNEEGQIRESGFKPGKLILTEIDAPLFVSFNPQEKRILDLKANNRDEEHKISNDVKKTNVKVTKNWVGVNESDIKGKQVSVKLLKNGVLERTETLNEANSWQYTFENLPKYDGQGKEISYDVEEVKQEGYSTTKSGNAQEGFVITNTKEGKVSIGVTKNWIGPAGDKAEINLLKNGIVERIETLNEANSWQYTFENLPKYDGQGKEISYDVEEVKQEGYSTRKSGSVENGFIITNTKEGKASFDVKKNWVGPIGKTAEIKLLKNGELEKTVTLNEANNWQYRFEDLPKYDGQGKEISYDIEEIKQDGYSTTKSGSVDKGFVITNTKEGKVSFDVKKNWVGPIGKTAEIKLLKNGELEKTVTLNEANNWQYRFEDLPKYDVEGKEISYDVEEVKQEGYSTTKSGNAQEGFVITNTKEGKVSIGVTKNWIGPAGEKAEINLLKNGIVERTETLNEANSWQYTFENLPKYDGQGKEISYDVEEVKQEGYSTRKSGSVESGFIITNTKEGKASFDVKKNWVGPIGKTAEIKLLKNGELEKTVTLNEANNWQYRFEDLPKYDGQGKEISYDIEEIKQEGYSTTKSGNAQEGFVITNTKEGKVSIGVTKNWIGPAGDKAEINLLKNGIVERIETLNEANSWQYTFEDLPKYDGQGKEISYDVEEVKQEGYSTRKSGSVENGFIITNTKEGKASFDVKKNWVGPIGKTAEIKLLKNGELEKTVTLNEANNWQYRFEDLPKYDVEGKEISYDVEEIEQEGYSTTKSGSVDKGFVITNTKKGKLSIGVTKNWVGSKGDKAIINLLRRSTTGTIKVKEVTLNEANNWQYTFEDLPKYDVEGKEISYDVEEVEQEGYSTRKSGSVENGFVITNTKKGKLSIGVTKNWIGTAGEKAEIKLLKNGTVERTEILNEANNWQYTFEDLPKYDVEGKEISYDVEEVKQDGYSVMKSGNIEEGFVITNTKDPEKPYKPNRPGKPGKPGYTKKINISGKKYWKNDEEKERPKDITIILFRNGEEIERKIVSKNDNWEYNFGEFDLNDRNGEKYEYKLREIVPKDYRVKYDGFDIVNEKEEEGVAPMEPVDKDPEKPDDNNPKEKENSNDYVKKDSSVSNETSNDKKSSYTSSGKNPQTLVEGYSKYVIGFIILFAMLIFVDIKRRRS